MKFAYRTRPLNLQRFRERTVVWRRRQRNCLVLSNRWAESSCPYNQIVERAYANIVAEVVGDDAIETCLHSFGYAWDGAYHETVHEHLSSLGAGLAGALAIPAVVAAQQPSYVPKHGWRVPSPASTGISPLIDKVRVATARFLDINVALNEPEPWVRGTPCVSGPNSGAMGVHFVLPSRIGDGVLNANEPEALIYEPLPNGALRLVGVEFIVLASDWARLHPEGGTPALEGHLTNYVGEPNRFGLPAFYELHVWAWEHNPNGSFADWNTQVSCENQPAN